MAMNKHVFGGFVDEMQKIAAGSSARSAADLLAAAASKKGLRPSMLPALNQVKNVANSGNRDRAAEIALNVRKYIKSAA